MKSFKLFALASAVALALTGCATTKTADADNSITPAVSSTQAQPEQNINFPDIDKAKFSSNNYKGSWPNWDNVAQLEYGMSKDQVRELVGSPHFKEGLWGVNQWDFVFNYRDSNNQHQVCQMQVHFDKDMLTTAYYWKGVDCETQASGKKTPAQQTVVNNIIQQMPATEQLKETFQFGADALFGFDKYGVADIKAEGRQMLDRLANSIQAYGDKRISVFIIGHTDRLGSDNYNFDLSKKRADTVATYLLSKGVKPTVLNTLGAGELMPVKQCASGTRAQLIECLQPNRRVEVKIYSYE